MLGRRVNEKEEDNGPAEPVTLEHEMRRRAEGTAADAVKPLRGTHDHRRITSTSSCSQFSLIILMLPSFDKRIDRFRSQN